MVITRAALQKVRRSIRSVRSPATAFALALALLAAGCSSHHPAVDAGIPRAAGSAAGWRDVIDDWWYDGRINGRHSCAAVRVAIRHLPQDAGIGSAGVRADLQAYERRICGTRRSRPDHRSTD